MKVRYQLLSRILSDQLDGSAICWRGRLGDQVSWENAELKVASSASTRFKKIFNHPVWEWEALFRRRVQGKKGHGTVIKAQG